VPVDLLYCLITKWRNSICNPADDVRSDQFVLPSRIDSANMVSLAMYPAPPLLPRSCPASVAPYARASSTRPPCPRVMLSPASASQHSAQPGAQIGRTSHTPATESQPVPLPSPASEGRRADGNGIGHHPL
jgi:hypothetical protein